MDYERDNYLRTANLDAQRIANMQQQQQQHQEMQHKLQMQHHQHLQQQPQPQPPTQQPQIEHHQLLQQPLPPIQPQQQQPQQQPTFDYHHHHQQQQQHQYHQYLQQQHSYHLQQQQQQQQNEHAQLVAVHHHHQQQQQQILHQHHQQQQHQHHHQQQQMLLHNQELLRGPSLLPTHMEEQPQQPQQQQQPHMNTTAMPATTMPNYINANNTVKLETTTSSAAATTTTTPSSLAHMQQQQHAQIYEQRTTTPAATVEPSTTTTTAITTTTTNSNSSSSSNNMYTTTTTTTAATEATTTTTTTTPASFATSQSGLQQQHHHHYNNNLIMNTPTYNNNNNSNNKTDENSLTTYSNAHINLSNNIQNGVENAQFTAAAYSKYYQPYATATTTTTTTTANNQTTIPATIQPPASPTLTRPAPTNECNEETTPTTTTSTLELPLNENENEIKDCIKRKNETENDDSPEIKKALADKNNININLRKNIRDVMDETQLDMNTLAAQREESERLARVAEQQKALREYQRQTAVNRQFARTQNRVISLLQSGKTYAKYTESNVESAAAAVTIDLEADGEKKALLQQPKLREISAKPKLEQMEIMEDEKSLLSPPSVSSSKTESERQQPVGDVVTIEDSSSEDDCILLSDDEDEELMEEDTEDDPHNSGLHVNDNYNVADELGRVVINVGHPEGEEDIYVAPQIAKKIKPHQIGGVRFLFDNVIESIKRFKNSSGFGCILAHSMGLGKTLQIVCFCDIFLRHTNSKTVLCVMPINTLQNWVNEFNMWTPRHSDNPEEVRTRHFDVFVLNDQHKTLSARAKVILRWAEQGGVLLIGYELFRLLALKIMPQRKRRGQKQLAAGENTGSESHKRLTESIYQALVKPGPDLVICDEGHRIKNAHAGISLALKQIRTRRRIVLTGYPLQNNLLEYWCMVDFVRPNYLGTRTEFCNMFERPIQNGQCVDSTPEDIKLMRYRAHVLHSLLVGFVQRRSHTVLQQTLPQKLEYVILTRMTTFQRQLYETFMNDVVRTRTVPNPLKAFSVCCKIWNHPDVLYNFLKRHEHDLDIEIEEGEIVPETPITPIATTTTTATSNSNSISVETTEISSTTPTTNTPSSIVSATLVDESQTSSSGFSSMTAPTPTPSIANSETPSTSQKHNNECYDNLPYAAHTTSGSVAGGSGTGPPPDCNGNNYWLEPNLPYYAPYPSVMHNHNSMQQPDYVGIVVKPRGTPGAENVPIGSSEIVDLDTKEIKTVETDIDMVRNTVIKSETTTPTKNADNKDALETAKTEDVVASKIVEETVKPTEREIVRWSDGVPYDWALDLMRKYEPDLIENSPKMEVFFCILHQSIDLGDRVLLFSQSLLTLNLIERFLQANYVPGTENYWARNSSYFRLDGSTSSQEREKLVNEFNSNFNVKLFLISTRAGSLGINLVGANRVVVFDASWNPCHDTQAVYRIYR